MKTGKLDKLISLILKWRVRHLTNRQFAIILSLIIGIIVGFAAVTLRWMIGGLAHFIHSESFSTVKSYFYFGLPLIGIGLTLLFIRFFIKGNLPSGISYLLYIIGRKESRIKRKHTFGHLVGSALTVSFGGSVGVEGPIVLTGSALGAKIGEFLHIDRQMRMLLIGCGSSAAIAAIFNAPVAGVLFTLEVILAEMKVGLLVPLLIASVTGITVSKLLLGDHTILLFKSVESIHLSDYPLFILLGLVCGALSVYFMRINSFFIRRMNGIKSKTRTYLLGGLSLGLLIVAFPSLFGEGYWTLRAIINNETHSILDDTLYHSFEQKDKILLLFIFGSILLKPIATSLTRLAGGVGGVFAPTLLMGGLSGFLVSRLANKWGNLSFSEHNFTLVGMAGVAAGVLHSPLTSIFLIAELTNGYELFVPLMIVAAISYGTSFFFERHSFYTKTLAERGDLIVHDKDKSVLTSIGIRQVIERDLKEIKLDGSLRDLVQAISVSERNIFPVIDELRRFQGIISLNDVRDKIFKPELYDQILIKDIMHQSEDIIDIEEAMDVIMKKFDDCNAWNLPVVDKGVYIGFISKSKIFNSYRKRLKEDNI